MDAPTALAPATGPEQLQKGAKLALAVLTFINLFNYLDRYVVAALAESLKKEPELRLSDTQLGLLMSGFVIVYMLTSPFFGFLGDKRGRPRLIAAGVALWSLATAGAGLARGFLSLFLSRSAVGIGEAAYGTIAPALLADFFPKRLRGKVFSAFFAAIPIGSALGYVLGGLVDSRWGWRAAFFMAGLPGLLLAAGCLFLRDPPRGAQDASDPHAAHAPAGGLATYKTLLSNPAYALTVAGYAAYTFALGGMAFWMPAFLERERGFAHADATVEFGKIVVITGFLGTIAGGWLGDRLLERSRQAYLWLSGVATLLAAPFALVAFRATDPHTELGALVVTELLIFASTGPINWAILNVVAPDMRASAVALSILSIHLFGDVPSPPLIGTLSDLSNLSTAVLIVPVMVLVAGGIWTAAAYLGGRKAWAA